MRSPFSITALLLALAAAQCVSPRPSAEPLGWGPLPPGAASAAHRPTSRKTTPGETKARALAEGFPAPDAGGAASEKTAAVPSGSASQGPPESKPPGVSAPSSSAVAELVGDYLGEDVATYRISGLPDRTERDPKARITVKASSGTQILFVLVDSSNGKEICTLSGDLKESAVTIGTGQKCFEQSEGEAAAAATVTKGSARFEKKRLVLELDLDFEMSAGGKKLTGSLDYEFDGKRQ
jgi:hypothetical protein